MLIVSVPHTGTHFLINLCEQNGIECKSRHYNGYNGEDRMILSPIRDPRQTWITWASRGREQDSNALWLQFDLICRTRNVFVLPIDTRDREKHLNRLSGILDKELKTDWAKQGSGPRLEVEVPNLDHIYKLKVVKDFYAGTE